MDNQDKIFNKIKNAAHKAEEKDFPGMEKVWQQIDARLENKELQNKTKIWKKIAIAASVVLLVSLSYQFLKTDSKITAPSEIQQNKVVIEEKSENIKTDAAVILKKQIEKQAAVTMSSENNSAEAMSSADAVPVADLKDSRTGSEETAVNSPKKEAFISEEKKSDLTGASVAIVSGEDLRKVSIEEVAEALKGRVSGVSPTSAENLAETKAIASKEKNAKAKISSSYDATKRIISGIITDETNQPIPGANVFIKGTKKAAATDFDGKFSIQAEKGDQLVFSYMGYRTSYASVGESDKINMKLANDSMALNQVVVIGYGTTKKSDLTGAVAAVSNKNLKKVKTETGITKREKETIAKNKTNTFRNLVFDAIVVKSAYPKMKQRDSIIPKKTAETNGPLVVINGEASKTKYKSVQEAKKSIPKQLEGEELESLIVLTEPLYIINGVEYTEESLFGTHPTSPYAPLSKQNIETIEILQNEDAIDRFGEKGRKGVVIITTKNKVPIQK